MNAPTDTQNGTQDKGPTLLKIVCVLGGFVVILVSLRAFVRVRIIRHVGWDDCLLLLAAVSDFDLLEKFGTRRAGKLISARSLLLQSHL